ncbi:MAG TPA: hypothetical protein VMF66_10305 [Candidatus Acidoferrum sp.]|nr:hypothetical protein [Candidatus Acidoferrum sp.]
MSSGFNTDVRVGKRVYHVQTEDRGPNRPVIDTMVYQNGRVVHRRNCSYKHFAESVEFTPEGLRERVEEQHRCVIEDLRSGALNGDKAGPGLSQVEAVAESGASAAEGHAEVAARIATPPENAKLVPPGIRLQLLNPESWLTAGSVSLQLEILRRTDQQPQSAAQVEALIEGSLDEARHGGTTDEKGRVRIHFPLPKLGKGGLALVIQARADEGTDELRYVMRSNPRG